MNSVMWSFREFVHLNREHRLAARLRRASDLISFPERMTPEYTRLTKYCAVAAAHGVPKEDYLNILSQVNSDARIPKADARKNGVIINLFSSLHNLWDQLNLEVNFNIQQPVPHQGVRCVWCSEEADVQVIPEIKRHRRDAQIIFQRIHNGMQICAGCGRNNHYLYQNLEEHTALIGQNSPYRDGRHITYRGYRPCDTDYNSTYHHQKGSSLLDTHVTGQMDDEQTQLYEQLLSDINQIDETFIFRRQ